MTPEDIVAEAVKDAIDAACLTLGSIAVVAQRTHYPIWRREDISDCGLVVSVSPLEVVQTLQTRGGKKSRDIAIAVQILGDTEQKDTQWHDELAAIGVAIDKAIEGERGGYTWHASERVRLSDEWLRLGVYATEITAHYRRAGVD